MSHDLYQISIPEQDYSHRLLMKFSIAVSLVVFWGYDLILDKKPVKFLLLCLVAMTFHSTAIIMLPFYFVCNYKKDYLGKYIIAIGASVVFMLFGSRIFRYIPLGMFSNYATSQGIGSYTFILLMLLIVIATGLLDKSHYLKIRDQRDRNIINGTIISEVLIATSAILDVLFRLGYYYIFFMLCLLPMLLKSFEGKSAKIVKCILYGVLLIYAYKLNLQYKFCF